ncbi:enoyl-CoA hydratase [Polymorphobacter megasporae]|uniref:enoyl-CoA hydratase n=1 Tax=Glacieibacterium megasporae TaxID=2835787 RepID=UPI001C1E5C99|nr:enoyl-CoA hydratase [Polymorphobacter megasporae]UAJ10221.1 enoyl-CoA hydratase [Polymorphobacter megasporae]
MTDHIAVTIDGGIAEIRFARPEKKNAITAAMYAAMRDALLGCAVEDSVRVILFTAAGDSFTAGNDLADFMAPRPDSSLGEQAVTGFLRAIATAPKPLIAAVRGNAVGVGTTMLLHCDLVVASENARLQVPFVNLGLVPEAASSLLLPRVIGHARASAMVLLGDALDAATALAAGLVNRVVPDGDVETVARAMATTLAAKAPTAVRLAKALLKGDLAPVLARMDAEGVHFAAQLKSAECREAIAAFYEKRAPDFSRAA